MILTLLDGCWRDSWIREDSSLLRFYRYYLCSTLLLWTGCGKFLGLIFIKVCCGDETEGAAAAAAFGCAIVLLLPDGGLLELEVGLRCRLSSEDDWPWDGSGTYGLPFWALLILIGGLCAPLPGIAGGR